MFAFRELVLLYMISWVQVAVSNERERENEREMEKEKYI